MAQVCENTHGTNEPGERNEGKPVGVFFPDLWIEKQLIIEIKAVQNLVLEHEAQLINYLTATNVETGLLINFGPSVQMKRKFRDYRPNYDPRNEH